ncbi:unnamed protein product [Rhizopus stolonifer]
MTKINFHEFEFICSVPGYVYGVSSRSSAYSSWPSNGVCKTRKIPRKCVQILRNPSYPFALTEQSIFCFHNGSFRFLTIEWNQDFDYQEDPFIQMALIIMVQ